MYIFIRPYGKASYYKRNSNRIEGEISARVLFSLAISWQKTEMLVIETLCHCFFFLSITRILFPVDLNSVYFFFKDLCLETNRIKSAGGICLAKNSIFTTALQESLAEFPQYLLKCKRTVFIWTGIKLLHYQPWQKPSHSKSLLCNLGFGCSTKIGFFSANRWNRIPPPLFFLFFSPLAQLGLRNTKTI